MQESHIRFRAGQQVLVRDELWAIVSIDAFDRAQVVHLRGVGASNYGHHRSVVSPFDRVEAQAAPTRLRAVSRRRALATAAGHAANAIPWQHCRTAAAACIDLRAWQLEPAMAAVSGVTRLLLADHVGLGKTIQAALIVAELLARGLAERVLVLTPAPLREQWAAELRDRFGLAPAVFDQAALAATGAALPAGVNPWLTTPLVVSSIDLVKRADVRSAIDTVAFDVLIVDEAHHLTPGSERGALVADLAARTPWVVLVTATPHTGDEVAFRFLSQIGSAAGDDGVTMFRRSAALAEGRLARRSRVLLVAPTDAERAVLMETARYAHAVRRASRRGGAAVLVASVIARRAASSAEALRRTLARRIALLAREVLPDDQPCLPWEDADAADADVADAVLAISALADVRQELDWLRRLLPLAEAAAVRSSKVGLIRRLLRRTSEPLLIFSEYRDVAVFIAEALADLTTVAALHGGLSARERHAIVHAFTRGTLRTVVATDAAGEGLNLHHRCRLVINVELPWMPRRLEQRIGRVDRIGQTRRVHALHLAHRASFEGTVIARLEHRRILAHSRTRDADIVESDTPASQARRLNAHAARFGIVANRSSVYAVWPKCRDCKRLVAVFGAQLIDTCGRLTEHLAVPVIVDVDAAAGMRHHLSRRLLRHLIASRRIGDVVDRLLAAECDRTQLAMVDVAAALERRFAACLAAVRRQGDGRPWQASLFDRAHDTSVVRRTAAHAAMGERLERQRAAVAALAHLQPTEPRLLAAWLAE